MGNIYEFPRKKTESTEELELSVAVKKYYEELGESQAVVAYAHGYAKSLINVNNNEVLFSVDLSPVKADSDAEHIHKQIQEGITNICTSYQSEIIKLKAKLVNANVKVYKLKNGL